MSKQKYLITLMADATPEDATAMKKHLAQSIANDFGLSCVEGVSIRPSDDFPILRLFLEQEVPYRLREHVPIDDALVTEDVVSSCVDALFDDSDVIFNYDGIDNFLCSTLRDMGLPVNE